MPNTALHRILSLPPSARANAAPAALPSTLAGLVAWGEGSDLGADGTSIASWLNKTLSGLDAAQGTGANQPTVKANAINGQKAALFTRASNQWLGFPAGALGWFSSCSAVTMVAVVQSATLVSSDIINVGITASDAPRYGLQTAASGALISRVRSDDSTVMSIGGATLLRAATPVIAYLTAANALGGPLTINIGSTLDGTTSISPAQATPATNAHSITIGGRADGTSMSDGYIAAYAMWTAAYSRVQLAGVFTRWRALYGV